MIPAWVAMATYLFGCVMGMVVYWLFWTDHR